MYKIELNYEQLKVMSKALELYARIGITQIEEVLSQEELAFGMIKNEVLSLSPIREKLRAIGEEIRGCIKSKGSIMTTRKPTKLACEMYQTINHHLAWEENPKGGGTVNFQSPLKISGTNLIKITKE